MRNDKEVLTIELLLEKTKTLLSCCYRPPDGVSENLSMFLQHIVNTSDAEKKKSFVIGDFNMNCFLYNDEYKVKKFYDNF